MTRPRVKICCIASREEARMAVECGASAVGLVSAMPSGPGPIAEELIAEIAARVPPGVATFLLTCRQDADSMIEQQRRCRVNTIQLCDRVGTDVYAELRAGLPGFLAGGLKPENVAEAFETVRPFGLDVCSGVRTNGRLDAEKLKRFFAHIV